MIHVTKDILRNIYKERPRSAKKYDFGLLLVIGGSQLYSGSPALSALSAFKAGVDMVRVIAPKRAADIIATFKPDLTAYPLPGDRLERSDVATLISMSESAEAVSHNKTAIVIGGGIGRSEDTQGAVLEFLANLTSPAVIDADAIHALAKDPKIVADKNFLITPHTYEFYVLTGREVYKLPDEEKIKIVQEEAGRLKTTILLKGATDIISNGKDVALSNTGCAFMTKGGMGDTLAGIAGAFLARGLDAFMSAQAAAFINGMAGEIASKKLKESVMASDLIEAIPEALRS